jgi:hypothetical protein
MSRFDVLHRRFVRLVNSDVAPVPGDTIRNLLADATAYFRVPAAPDSERSPFFERAVIRGCAMNLVERSAALPWHADVAAFVETLPSEEALPDGRRFTSDYVTPFQQSWRRALHAWIDVPDVQGLEVGSFEGRSAIWFLQNILTHPTSRLTCIDTFDFAGQGSTVSGVAERGSGLQNRFDQNLSILGLTQRVHKYEGRSQERLRVLPLDHYQFAYLDGSHLTCDVLEDLVLMWRLLRTGGVLILDDYAYRRNHFTDALADPGFAIDAFTSCFAGKWTELHRDYQLILRKDVA